MDTYVRCVFAAAIMLAAWFFGHAPAARGAEVISLDGPWWFTIDSSLDESAWDTVSVPGNWDALERYSRRIGQAWYRRSFSVPAAWRGKHVRLCFGAVYHDAEVSLNGQVLGRHVGGYTPFEFTVTDTLRWDRDNIVTVRADNTYRRGAWWHWGGISRSVNLVADSDVRLVRQYIRAEPDLANGTATVHVRYRVANAGGVTHKVTLASTIDNVAEPTLESSITLAAGSSVDLELSALLPQDRVRLWHFDHPQLYRLATRLSLDGELQDTRTDRFGIRKVEVTRGGLLLNGERVRLCGFNRVSDSLEHGNTEPDELVRRDVDLMKQCGANMARLMHVPQAPNLLDYLDEKGMLIFAEIPVWGGDDPQVRPDNPLTQQWMQEMIERDYNHPCIIGWSVGNELLNHYDYVKSMIEFTRQLDPHRLITYVSFSGARKDYNPTNDPISLCDIILHNMYGYNSDAARIVHEKWPDKPIFFSEIGVRQFGPEEDAIIPNLEGLWSKVGAADHPWVIGAALWTFNDYRSDYRGTPPSGNREWGVVDVHRRPKAAYRQVRALFSPVRSLKVNDGMVFVEPRGSDEIPSFILRGYRLSWSLPDGKSSEIELPDLKPGDDVWSHAVPKAPGLRVGLVSPTGYTVHEFGTE